jgi:hypothetical protein
MVEEKKNLLVVADGHEIDIGEVLDFAWWWQAPPRSDPGRWIGSVREYRVEHDPNWALPRFCRQLDEKPLWKINKLSKYSVEWWFHTACPSQVAQSLSTESNTSKFGLTVFTVFTPCKSCCNGVARTKGSRMRPKALASIVSTGGQGFSKGPSAFLRFFEGVRTAIWKILGKCN